jgi:hypothetical protein
METWECQCLYWVTDTQDGGWILNASAHLLSRAFAWQLSSESCCIKYWVTSSVVGWLLEAAFIVYISAPPAFVFVGNGYIVLKIQVLFWSPKFSTGMFWTGDHLGTQPAVGFLSSVLSFAGSASHRMEILAWYPYWVRKGPRAALFLQTHKSAWHCWQAVSRFYPLGGPSGSKRARTAGSRGVRFPTQAQHDAAAGSPCWKG